MPAADAAPPAPGEVAAGDRPTPSGATAARAVRLRVPFLLVALLIGVASRVYSGLLVASAAGRQEPNSWTGSPVTYTGMTMMWDGTWYRRIAENGYPAVLPHDAAGALQQNEWAFYPLFPMTCRAIMAVTGLGFREVGGSLSVGLSLVATVLVAVCLRRFMSDRGALLATAVWACFFAAPTMNLAYTESLAVLLLAGFLLLVLDRRWWAAAAVALLIGVARPVAVPLGVVALVACAHRFLRGPRPVTAREGVAMLASLVACGIAGFTWPAVAWWATGSRTAYTDTMTTWRAAPEIVPFRPWLDNARYFFGEDKGPWVLVAAVVGYALVALGPWAWRLPPAVHAWVVAYPLYLGAVLDPISSTYRYLLPLFPVAGVLVGLRAPRWQQWVVGAGLVVAGCAAQVWWVDSFLVFRPPTSWPP